MRPMSIQIPTWIWHPQVWTFVCFVSTIVGLLCYALSSSFNSLYGKWNFTKLFLYIVLSIIILQATLFPKVWQHSTSHSFKVHMGFLVLTITTLYSFFLDQAVNGKKPDAYSVVSSVAFAMTTLSLSRQIECGFEVDLLYFFLGALIGQLLKIKKWLAVVGLLFCYFLVILRSSLAKMQRNGYIQLGRPNGDQTAIEIDSQQSIMTRLTGSIEALRRRNPALINMISAHVKDYINDIDDSKLVIDHNFVVDALSSRIIGDLHEAARDRADARREREFSEAYINCRRECLKECLSRITKSREEPNTLRHENDTVGRWVKAANVALRQLFPCERRLCDRVFDGLSSAAADRCFMEICREETNQLLSLADSFANRSPSMDRMFQNLYVFVSLRDLIPEFQSMFIDGQRASLVIEAVTIRNKLREAILASYTEMRDLIFDSEIAKSVVPDDGGVQLMTRDAMNFILYCCHSQEKLEPILQECLKSADGAGTSSPFSVEMGSLLELLERKLERSSMGYKDPALRYFFMMNNRKHIENQIKKFDLGTHLRDDWVQNNTEKIQQNLELYYKSSWKGVLDYLKLDKESLAPNAAAESMKERLNLFYRYFKEMCVVQSTWFVEDEQLREEIITYLGNHVALAYGNFIWRFTDVLATNASEYIRYGIDDIEARLKDLFRPAWMYNESVA